MAHRYCDDTDFRLGTTPQNLISLRRLGVPVPDTYPGDRATSYYVRGDNSRVGDGFAFVNWIWDVISQESLYRVLDFLNGEDFVRLYVRTAINRELYPSPRTAFNVYYGIMYRPNVSGIEGTPITRSPYAFQTVQIQFRDLVLQPGYL